ncbi:MAG: cyclase family protein [Paracoccaceae bacterium]
MCDMCVINSVRKRMLTRRDLFKAAPAAAAIAAVGAAPAALAQSAPTKVVDMTHTLSGDFPTYFGVPGFSAEQQFNFAEHGFNVFNTAINEHTGTHMDAPLHFSADGQSVDQIPVEGLVCPLAIVDIRAKADGDVEAQVTPEDLAAWKAANGDFPDNCCVAMYSGWENHLGTPKFRGADDAGVQHYPAFHVEAAQMLMEETGAVGIAVDTLSLDNGSSTTFDTHYTWLPTNRWGLENVANLGELPASGATIVVGAPKHRGGSGGPSRLIALV